MPITALPDRVAEGMGVLARALAFVADYWPLLFLAYGVSCVCALALCRAASLADEAWARAARAAHAGPGAPDRGPEPAALEAAGGSRAARPRPALRYAAGSGRPRPRPIRSTAPRP
jgi:hypothetical protein